MRKHVRVGNAATFIHARRKTLSECHVQQRWARYEVIKTVMYIVELLEPNTN
jgi:hypothetical protein